MTLAELLTACCGDAEDVRCPVCFLDVEVEENTDEFCRLALKKYFYSDKFYNDLEEYEDSCIYAKDTGMGDLCFVYFERNFQGVFTARLDVLGDGD